MQEAKKEEEKEEMKDEINKGTKRMRKESKFM